MADMLGGPRQKIGTVIGAIGLTGAAIMAGNQMTAPLEESVPDDATLSMVSIAGVEDDTLGDLESDGDFRICLTSNFVMIRGLEAGCYSRRELREFRESPVVGYTAKEVTVSLSHPSDVMASVEIARTCGEYRSLMQRDWYALSNREMRRQAFFDRGCGALEMLINAREARRSAFVDGKLKDVDVELLSAGAPFRITDQAVSDAVELDIANTEPGIWRLSTIEQDAQLQEIAHADFNNDGDGDIMAFAIIGSNEGTMKVWQLGLIEKPQDGSSIRFTPFADQ